MKVLAKKIQKPSKLYVINLIGLVTKCGAKMLHLAFDPYQGKTFQGDEVLEK